MSDGRFYIVHAFGGSNPPPSSSCLPFGDFASDWEAWGPYRGSRLTQGADLG